MTLLAKAQHWVSADSDAQYCWTLIARAIEVGWLDLEDLHMLLDHLRRRSDFGTEELLFAFSGNLLLVSFLRETVSCQPTVLIEELAQFISGGDSGQPA